MIGKEENAERARPKRRWFQYSLGTLLLVMTIFGLWLGMWADRARKQRQAVAALKEFGDIHYRYMEQGKNQPPGPAGLRGFLGVDYFDHVTAAYLYQPGLSDAHLEPLSGLSRLETLAIEGDISGAGLEHLKRLGWLKRLDLCSTRITDDDLAALEPLSGLKELRIWGTISAAGMRHLTCLKQLRRLEYMRFPPGVEKYRAVLALEAPSVVEFRDVPLTVVLEYLSDYHGIQFTLEASGKEDAPVTASAQNEPLGEVLTSILTAHELDWTIGPTGLIITSKDALAEQRAAIAALREAVPGLKAVYVESGDTESPPAR